jgi:hypothetical protein
MGRNSLRKRFGTAPVAIQCKYSETKWASLKTGSAVKRKLREAPQDVLPGICL